MAFVPFTKESVLATVSGTAATFALVMVREQTYVFLANTDVFIKQDTAAAIGATPATAASGSMFVPAGREVAVIGRNGDTLSVIQSTAGGRASLTRSYTH
jgi:hypothetical protein